MKRFEAFYVQDEKNNHLMKDGEIYATEVRFDILAETKERALELIDREGGKSSSFYLEEVNGVKNQMGKYFPESIRDARI